MISSILNLFKPAKQNPLPNEVLKIKGLISYFYNLNANDLTFIKERRNGSMIFKNEKGNSYIRVWNKQSLEKEFNAHRIFEAASPKITKPLLKIDSSEDYWMYEEANAGDTTYGNMFRHRIWDFRKLVSKEEFDNILENLSKTYRLTAKHILREILPETEILQSLYFYDFQKEMEEGLPEGINIPLYEKYMNEVVRLVKKWGFKYWFLHWDLNMFNVANGWIIDFEESRYSIVGLDWVNVICHNLMFWKKDISKIAYSFSTERINRLVDKHTEITGVNVMENFKELIFLRLLWWVGWLVPKANSPARAESFRMERLLMWEEIIKAYFEGNLGLERILNKNNMAYEAILAENNAQI